MTIHAQPNSGLALLFEPQSRPAVDDVAALVAQVPQAARSISISHRPASDEGWLEVLCRGLTFDVSGLSPARPDVLPAIRYRFDLAEDYLLADSDVVTIGVGHHLTGGASLLPVVRAHVEVARALMALPGLRAVVWCPADVAMSPQHFERVMAAWAGGGPFPALGLTHVRREADGGMRSHGLSFFTGQEVRIDPVSGQNTAALGKIIVRLIHRLVEGGRLEAPCLIVGPDGEDLRVEPTENGQIVRVWGTV